MELAYFFKSLSFPTSHMGWSPIKHIQSLVLWQYFIKLQPQQYVLFNVIKPNGSWCCEDVPEQSSTPHTFLHFSPLYPINTKACIMQANRRTNKISKGSIVTFKCWFINVDLFKKTYHSCQQIQAAKWSAQPAEHQQVNFVIWCMLAH